MYSMSLTSRRLISRNNAIREFRLACRASSSASCHVNEPEWAAHEEPIRCYAEDTGYLPILLGQENGQYTVLRKLGWGTGSTVWLAQDQSNDAFASLKILTGYNSHAHGLGPLSWISSSRPARNRALTQAIHTFFNRLPSGLARHVTRQVLKALDYLHTECNIVHTDIKPDNIMLGLYTEEIQGFLTSTREVLYDTATFSDGKRVTRVQSTPIPIPVPPGDVNTYDSWRHVSTKIADLDVAYRLDAPDGREMIQSPALRAPEVCIGAGWGTPADIWSVACLAFQLSMGESLIKANCEPVAVPFYQAMYFGDLPLDMLQRGKYSAHFYHEDGTLKMGFERRVSIEEIVHRGPPAHAELFIDFLKCAFVVDPLQRPTARQLLKHKWLQPD